MAAEELLSIVDTQDTPLPWPMTRAEVHAHGGIWHRTSSIFILNEAGQILCQKRSLLMDRNPGKWAFAFGGHVLFGEEVLQSAVKELQEELALEVSPTDVQFFTKVFDENSMHAEYIYFLHIDRAEDAFAHNPEEVEKVQWMPANEVARRSDTPEFSFPLYKEVRDHLGLV